ncbi:thioesterase domain-containing protein [Scytonema sp. UIC 10036]|uniref:thioesterase domain-containing protein n=1 Tax=Scytonema sp. UIC 10036 TaxID=2304196 RepID=UPI0012DA6704
MNLIEFLQDLAIQGWELWSEGEKLRYRTSKGELTSSVLTQLKQHKSEILELLRDRPDIFNVDSVNVEQLTASPHQNRRVVSPSPLVPIQSRGSKVPIFCVHPYTGLVICYHELARLLGSDRPFYGLKSLGIEEGEEPLTRVEDMATLYLRAVREVQPHGPYILMGWSFGGIVALQMAHELKTQGEQVPFLGLLDTYTPSHLPEQSILSQKVVIEGETLSISLEELRRMPIKQQAVLICEQFKQADLIPSEVERLLRVQSLNCEAMRNYSPPLYSGRSVLFRAEKGVLSFSQNVSALEPTLGWEEAIANIELHVIPGYHEYMVDQPNVSILAQKLKDCIEQALSSNEQ